MCKNIEEPKARPAVGCTELLVVAKALHKAGHKAAPFMTMQSGGDEGIVIKMKCHLFDDAQELHAALCNFFSTNASNQAERVKPEN